MNNNLKTGGVPIQNLAPLPDSSSLLSDSEALRQRADVDGFLFFRALLPRQDILRVRRDLLATLDADGWREQEQDPEGGRLNLDAITAVPEEEMRLDIGVTRAIYHAAQKQESVHILPHHPQLLSLYKTLFNAEVLVHPRHIIRMITPHPGMVPTPSHQDFPLIQGTPQTWTCWISLGDCPRDLGGLAVLRGSHRRGYLPIAKVAGAGGLETQLCNDETDWVGGDYQAGDVLTFPAYTVHRGTPCQRKNEVRLSLDVRYQCQSAPLEQLSLLPHCELSWEEIYADWQSDTLKFYWQDHDLELSPWDDTLHQPSRRIC